MVGRTEQPTIGELGQVVGVLTKYEDYLLYEANQGALLDEDPRDAQQRELAIESVSNCIKTVAEDLKYRLSNY